jgi:hypothetical protein
VRENLNIDDEVQEILKEDPQQLMKTIAKLKHQAFIAFTKAPLNFNPKVKPLDESRNKN